ncbi:DNA-binding NarL/FixJ family response regulator [Streptomyces sp. V4I23]|uniref:helix-turn-helix transcriptional regulator n=1 Tax=Streptomyces sp. V4I23 TaxID=3042282 RepID=UPI002784B741|nr:response regulator transcription factor [Streptomyces sp. V4I23]MDQ1005875.1 DNA-binding NarL/FixJ family response regulator [Streptomyces sp. V4I23]
MGTIKVAVQAADPITKIGLLSQIKQEPRIAAVTEESGSADVLVVAVEDAGTAAIEMLRKLSRSNQRILFIVDHRRPVDPRRVVECGVRAVIWRDEFTPAKFTSAIVSIGEGRGDLPLVLQGELLDQLQRTYREVLAPQGLTASGLAERELEVLRLVAEGYTLEEMSEKLRYSERTVKNILHRTIKHLNLRNRAQAVSFAIRSGLI